MRRVPHQHLLALSVCLFSAWLLADAAATVRPDAGQAATTATPAPLPLTLPNKPDSLKFGVMGDFGTGKREQYLLADQMARVRAQFPFVLMLTVGDNLYGGNGPRDFLEKFEKPYKPLLDGGVKFYASLGNHDSRRQSSYELFNMGGRTYYTFKAPKESVRFFALESDYLDPRQLQWLERELDSSGDAWKIPYFHHPLYSSGGRHGSDLPKRKVLEPVFLKYGVSVVFAGHDHLYERVKPQHGIVHFVVGSSGQLRKGNIEKDTGFTDAANATEQAFLVVEIDGEEMYFNAVSRTGKVIDSGVFARRKGE
jgi:3',5'-cyclic AMP phosphodiesterase CpdA